jgi:hypothetical protein
MSTIPSPGSVSFADRVAKPVPFDWGFGSTRRTAELRDALYWKAAVVKDFVNAFMGQGNSGRCGQGEDRNSGFQGD